MYKNVQNWMRLYVARVIKGGLMAVVASLLLFECSDDSSKMGNNPDKSVIGKVILSENALSFYDILGGTGVEYTISLSEDSALVKAVEITLTSDNDALVISPAIVNFTKTTGKAAQTIIVKGKADANDAFNKIPADITGLINHTITSNADNDPNIVTFQDGNTVSVRVWSTATADLDRDGLIEIYTAEMLQNMRCNLAGTSYRTSSSADGCPSSGGDSSGCPLVDPDDPTTRRCKGYELAVDIDLLNFLDTGGGDAGKANGMIDTIMIGIDTNADGDTTDNSMTDGFDKQVTVIDTGTGKDTSWMPIGDNLTVNDESRFTGIFEGNNHTIANLWVNGSFNRAGLFGVIAGTVEIRNVGVISGSVHSSSINPYSGSLVGTSVGSLMIVNSYFSGSGGVSASSGSPSSVFSGGLVGDSGGSLMIVNSYFSGSGGVSASSGSSSVFSGGLVGELSGSLMIVNSYFSGSGEISSSSATISSTSSASYSGGLIGASESNSPSSSDSLMIVNSYFSGSGKISSASAASISSGGLVGSFSSASAARTLTITNGYWNTEAPQSVNGNDQTLKRAQGNAAVSMVSGVDVVTDVTGATGLTLSQLQAISGTHPSDLPSDDTDNTKAWDLGTNMQLPAIKRCVGSITDGVCASYGALIAGQR